MSWASGSWGPGVWVSGAWGDEAAPSLDVRVGWAQFNPVAADVRVGWAQFNPLSADVRVGWVQFDPVAEAANDATTGGRRRPRVTLATAYTPTPKRYPKDDDIALMLCGAI